MKAHRSMLVLLTFALCTGAKAQTPPRGTADPFAPLSWQAPAPVPVTMAPQKSATIPSAPPLPFKYLGHYTADVALIVLTIGDRMIVARAGDTLEGGWRLDRVGPALIEFTHLPTQLKRSLATGDAG